MILLMVVFLLQILFSPSFTKLTFELHFVLRPIPPFPMPLASCSCLPPLTQPSQCGSNTSACDCLFCIVPAICKFQLSDLAESLMRSRSSIAFFPAQGVFIFLVLGRLWKCLSPYHCNHLSLWLCDLSDCTFLSHLLPYLSILFALPKWGLLPGLNFQFCGIHSFNFPPLWSSSWSKL